MITGLALLIVGILIAIPFIVMNPMIRTHVHFNKFWTAEEFGLTAEQFFVKTEDGLNISVYEVAVDRPQAVVICLSGIHNPSVTIYFGHARMFKEHSVATIMLDMRAHGESDGEKIYLGYKEWLDVKAVVKYIKEKPLYNNVPIVVLGLSMGGATAVNAMGRISEIDGLISLSSFSSWEGVFYDNMLSFVPKVIADIEKPFIRLANLLTFGPVSCSIKPEKEIKKLGNRPALLVHSKEDSQVPYQNFERLLKQAPSHTETFIREGDAHFITDYFDHPEMDTEYAERIIEFVQKVIHQHQTQK